MKIYHFFENLLKYFSSFLSMRGVYFLSNALKIKCKIIYRCKKAFFAIHKHGIKKAQNRNIKGNFCKHLHIIKHFEGRHLFCRDIFTTYHFSFCNQCTNCEHDKSHQTYSRTPKRNRKMPACKISCYQQCK